MVLALPPLPFSGSRRVASHRILRLQWVCPATKSIRLSQLGASSRPGYTKHPAWSSQEGLQVPQRDAARCFVRPASTGSTLHCTGNPKISDRSEIALLQFNRGRTPRPSGKRWPGSPASTWPPPRSRPESSPRTLGRQSGGYDPWLPTMTSGLMPRWTRCCDTCSPTSTWHHDRTCRPTRTCRMSSNNLCELIERSGLG